MGGIGIPAMRAVFLASCTIAGRDRKARRRRTLTGEEIPLPGEGGPDVLLSLFRYVALGRLDQAGQTRSLLAGIWNVGVVAQQRVENGFPVRAGKKRFVVNDLDH